MGNITITTDDGTTHTYNIKSEIECCHITLRLLAIQIKNLTDLMLASASNDQIPMITTKQLDALNKIADIVYNETVHHHIVLRYSTQLRSRQSFIDRLLGRTEKFIGLAQVVHSRSVPMLKYIIHVENYLREHKKVGRILSSSDIAYLNMLYAKYVIPIVS